MPIRAFSHDFEKALIAALGLQGRHIKKLRLEMNSGEPITLYIEEYANFDDGKPYLLANLLELSNFTAPEQS